MERKLLSSKQAAAYLGITTNSLYQLNHKKMISHYSARSGGRLCYDIADLDNYLTFNRIEANGTAK